MSPVSQAVDRAALISLGVKTLAFPENGCVFLFCVPGTSPTTPGPGLETDFIWFTFPLGSTLKANGGDFKFLC